MDLFEHVRSLPRLPRVGFVVDDAPAVPARRWESKIGGAPYLPRGAAYPTDDDARPLAFLAQVNLGHLETWRRFVDAPVVLGGQLPTEGVLQLYLPWGEDWGSDPGAADGLNRCRVLYCGGVVEDDSALAEPLVALADEGSDDVRLEPEARTVERYERTGHLASCHSGGEGIPLTQPAFGFPMRPARPEPEWQIVHPHHVDAPADVADAVREWGREHHLETGLWELIDAEFGKGGIQLGGHPTFTQGDPRPDSSLELLFQLDMSGNPTLEIGDVGVMNFLVPRGDLARGDLSRVRMSWDCS